MVAYKNFYETINESRMRLKNTIVKYKDQFFYVIDVTDHKSDGKFRVYMDEIGHNRVGAGRISGFPNLDGYGPESAGNLLDSFLEANPDCGLVRKYADSRHFEKFRPFPLGNVNYEGTVIYTERTPLRNMHQGLRQEGVMSTKVDPVPAQYDPHAANKSRGAFSLGDMGRGLVGNWEVDFLSFQFKEMLLGAYPSYQEVVSNLRDPDVLNKGAAFHREFSLMRGPIDMLFLCYRHSGVGYIDNDNALILGSPHEFLKEQFTELGVFNSITIKEARTYG